MEFEHVTFDLPHGTFHAPQGGFQLPGSGWMVTARDLALIDRLWRQWSPGLSLDPALHAELHEHLRASMPAPLKYYRAMLRPGMLGATRRLSQPIAVPLLQLHGADDGCILPPQVDVFLAGSRSPILAVALPSRLQSRATRLLPLLSRPACS